METITKNNSNFKKYLVPTYYIDSKHPDIIAKAKELTEGIALEDTIAKAIALFYFVRDQIKYHVENTNLFYSRTWLKASATLQRGMGYCIQKAVLLAALTRAIGIPSRLHFVDIINYLSPRKFVEEIGNELFIYHGFTEIYLNGKWIEANVAFDQDLCLRKNYPVGEFDGVNPCLFAHLDENGAKFVEYIRDRGVAADVPYWRIVITWKRFYKFKPKKK